MDRFFGSLWPRFYHLWKYQNFAECPFLPRVLPKLLGKLGPFVIFYSTLALTKIFKRRDELLLIETM